MGFICLLLVMSGASKEQNSWTSAWQHHGDHHDPPHEKHNYRVRKCPGGHLSGHSHTTSSSKVNPCHHRSRHSRTGAFDYKQPTADCNSHQKRNNYPTVILQNLFKRSVHWHGCFRLSASYSLEKNQSGLNNYSARKEMNQLNGKFCQVFRSFSRFVQQVADQ